MPTYRTYFNKDTGKYLGSYAPLDGDPHENAGNPHCGHPSVEGQGFNAKDRLNLVTQTVEKGVVVLPSPQADLAAAMDTFTANPTMNNMKAVCQEWRKQIK